MTLILSNTKAADPSRDAWVPAIFLTASSMVIEYPGMSDHQTSPDMAPLRKWIHDLNNRVGVILAVAELLQLEPLSPQALDRRQTIEDKSLEVREILQAISDHYFS